jgi:hypothetical protein
MKFNVDMLGQFTENYLYNINLVGFTFTREILNKQAFAQGTVKYYLISHENKYELTAVSEATQAGVHVNIFIDNVDEYSLPDEHESVLYRRLKDTDSLRITFEEVELSDMMDKFKVPVRGYFQNGKALDCGIFGVTLECETPECAGIFDDDKYFNEIERDEFIDLLSKF